MQAPNIPVPLPFVTLGRNSNLTFHNNNVKELLNGVKDLPISVITVCGPANRGKTLLLGFAAKYLQAVEDEVFEWNDCDNPDKPMEQLLWTNGSPEEEGIWAYNKPFVVGVDESSKRAVVLLYAQLPYKYSLWDDANSSIILAGFATCISSLTIFNLYKGFSTQAMSAISSYIKHGILLKHVSTTPKSKKPQPVQTKLQDLCFVIRDWNFPVDFPYGVSHGQIYLEVDRLNDNENVRKAVREDSAVIRKLATNIHGCLLPFPGMECLQSEFNGCLAELSEDFVSSVEDLIQKLLATEDFVLKTDDNKDIMTAQSWLEEFEAISKKANDKKHPAYPGKTSRKLFLNMCGIKVSLSLMEESEILSIASATYNEYWTKQVRELSVFNNNGFANVYQTGRRKAEKELGRLIFDSDDETDPEDDDTFEKCKKELEHLIISHYQEQLSELSKIKEESAEKGRKEVLKEFSRRSAQNKEQLGSMAETKRIRLLRNELLEKFSLIISNGVDINTEQKELIDELEKELNSLTTNILG